MPVLLYIEPGVFLLLAMLIMVLPLSWVLAALLAGIIHELFHLAAVLIFDGKLLRIRIGMGGAQITASLSGKAASIAAILAGPAGSLMLLLLCRSLPRLAVCGCMQGIYNLLPLTSLDGGRALMCLVESFWPNHAGKICRFAEGTTLFLLLLAASVASVALSLGWTPFLPVLFLLTGRIPRKIPCKRKRIGVQ